VLITALTIIAFWALLGEAADELRQRERNENLPVGRRRLKGKAPGLALPGASP
jgi:hypothetical protein